MTAVTSNGLDSATGENSGLGLYKDQYLSLKTIVEKCDGDFWGITKTELVKDIRINPRIPGMGNTFWYKVDAAAKRYYLHQQLITYYTDHGPRETDSQADDLDKKALLYRELLTEPFFWETLKKYNKKQYWKRCLKAMHFCKSEGDIKTFRIYAEMLKKGSPGVKQKVHSGLIRLLSPNLLRQIYLLKQSVS